MIAEDNFLRRLPQVISPAQRMDLEAIVFAHDRMMTALDHLHRVGLECRPTELSRLDRVGMFTAAWAIVDSIHVVRELILRAVPGGHKPAAEAWHARTDAATLLRNRMDHPRGILPTRAGSKGALPPTFGTLWFFRPIKEGAGSVRGDACFLTAGTAPKDATLTVPFDGAMALPGPVGTFVLQAYEWTFELEPPARDLEPLLSGWAETIEPQICAGVADIAAKNGMTVKEFMAANALGEVQGEMDVEFFR